MKNPGLIFVCAFALPLAVAAQDTVHLTDGTTRNVKITGVQDDAYIVSLPPPLPGQPRATTTIKRAGVSRIVFGPDPVLDAAAANAGPASLASARSRWQSLQPLLGIPESRAGEAGCLLGEILLQSDDPARHDEALALFNAVEAGAWKLDDRQRATRGRLGVLIKKGRLEEASKEAEEIARVADEPRLLNEAKVLLARARLASLKALLDENPRWKQDPPVVAEHDRLLNEGLDFALYPFLFNGLAAEDASEGLWVAKGLYELTDQPLKAAEVLQDIVQIYPKSRRATEAAALLKAGGNKPAGKP